MSIRDRQCEIEAQPPFEQCEVTLELAWVDSRRLAAPSIAASHPLKDFGLHPSLNLAFDLTVLRIFVAEGGQSDRNTESRRNRRFHQPSWRDRRHFFESSPRRDLLISMMCGLGATLVERFADWAKLHSVGGIQIVTSSASRSIPFYRRLGFRELRTFPWMSVTSVCMGRKL